MILARNVMPSLYLDTLHHLSGEKSGLAVASHKLCVCFREERAGVS